MQELERGDSRPPLASRRVQGALVMYPIHAFGIGSSRRNAGCPGSRAGEAIGCFGLTEPDHGIEPGR